MHYRHQVFQTCALLPELPGHFVPGTTEQFFNKDAALLFFKDPFIFKRLGFTLKFFIKNDFNGDMRFGKSAFSGIVQSKPNFQIVGKSDVSPAVF